MQAISKRNYIKKIMATLKITIDDKEVKAKKEGIETLIKATKASVGYNVLSIHR